MCFWLQKVIDLTQPIWSDLVETYDMTIDGSAKWCLHIHEDGCKQAIENKLHTSTVRKYRRTEMLSTCRSFGWLFVCVAVLVTVNQKWFKCSSEITQQVSFQRIETSGHRVHHGSTQTGNWLCWTTFKHAYITRENASGKTNALRYKCLRSSSYINWCR